MSHTRDEWTVLSMLKRTTSYFEEKKVNSPRLSIEWLLAYVLDVKRLDLYLKYDRPLSVEELDVLRPLVKRRANHEPLQYITGETDFYNCRIKVNPNVLIPRQETEQLVELIRKNHEHSEGLNVLDIGTGSGCIPISLKKEFESWKVSAFDVSEEAVELAKENGQVNNVSVDFFKHDLFELLNEREETKFDIIISNPPYILFEEKESLDYEVKNFEPHLALFCESTEKMYGAIEKFCSIYLSKHGVLYLEIHENYSRDVESIFHKQKWVVKPIRDLEEKSRFLIISGS